MPSQAAACDREDGLLFKSRHFSSLFKVLMKSNSTLQSYCTVHTAFMPRKRCDANCHWIDNRRLLRLTGKPCVLEHLFTASSAVETTLYDSFCTGGTKSGALLKFPLCLKLELKPNLFQELKAGQHLTLSLQFLSLSN